jgi:hypothetical protein
MYAEPVMFDATRSTPLAYDHHRFFAAAHGGFTENLQWAAVFWQPSTGMRSIANNTRTAWRP